MYTVPVPFNKVSQRYRDQVGEAIYLMMYFIQRVNWETGKMRTNCYRIAHETGFPVTTIRRWLQVLVEVGEISTVRIMDGLIITLNDYSAIAHTRGVSTDGQPQAERVTANGQSLNNRVTGNGQSHGSDRKRVIANDQSECPEMDGRATAGDQSECPEMVEGLTAGGESNIKQNIVQNKKQNDFKTLASFLSVFREGEARPDGPRGKMESVDDEHSDALALIEGMDDDEKADLRRKAMECLESDRRPFIRCYIRRNENGDLEPVREHGRRLVTRKMAEMAGSG